MLLSVVLTSCGAKDEAEEETVAATTLSMLLVTEEQVYYTDAEYQKLSAEEKLIVDMRREQYAAVVEEINGITKAKYKIQLNIEFYTEEQYYDILESKLEAIELYNVEKKDAEKEYKKFVRNEKRSGNMDELKAYELFVEKYPDMGKYIDKPVGEDEKIEEDVKEDIYPEISEDQVDILFLGDYDKYMDYIDKNWLASIGDTLKTGTAKKLTSYIYPAFLNAAKTDKGYFAIPNNTIVGEYTTLLVNKEMCDKYSDISVISDLYTALDLIADVAEYESNIDPVWYSSYRGYTNVHFWSVEMGKDEEGYDTYTFDPDKFSVLGATYNPDYTSKIIGQPNCYSFGNLLQNDDFINQLVALTTLEEKGYYGADGSENDFAVGIVKGTKEELEVYSDDYYFVTLEYPVAEKQDLFKSMFAVSSYTSDVNRSMEIITLLNTNETFRNLLQYGIRGVNYDLTEGELATRTTDNLYVMDINKTGNMFIAYPDADKGMTYEALENAKKQDLEVKFNPTINFEITREDLPDKSNITTVNKASVEFEEIINGCKTVAELEEKIAYINSLINGGDAVYFKAIVQKAMLPQTDGVEKDFSVYALYDMWCKSMGYTS